MSNCIDTRLHPEDETRLIARCEDGSVHVIQVEPIADDGHRFRVTMPSGQVFTPWCEAQIYNGIRHEWACHASPGHTTARLREYHACLERQHEDIAGDTLPIRIVLEWLECRTKAQAEGQAIRSLLELSRAERNRDAQMNRLLADEPNAAASFFAQHGARRCGRRY